ncbi:MAG: FAD-dependent oxidoreductase [bacterium]|nr:FAD-dependent oxidoreductase [bacterium]
MNQSIWSKEERGITYPPNTTNRNVEVAVIGGGLAGILTAYLLQQQGLQVEVFEAETIGTGMTEKTTAKITSQHRLIYDRLISQYGLDKAREYASRNEAAIVKYEEIVNKLKIDCGFKKESAYVYTTKEPTNIKNEVMAAKKCGINAYYTTNTALPFEVTGAVCFQNQASFHPIKFLNIIAEKLTINEKSRVLRMKKHELEIVSLSDEGEEKTYQVSAKYIVIATHYPMINHPGYYFTRMHQERSYVIAVKRKEALPYGMYIGECDQDYSFRKYENYVLIGGMGHRTGSAKKKDHYGELIRAAEKYYPGAKIEYKWSNQDCIAIDEIPYIGRFSKRYPDVFVATGFNKWGMSSSMVSAMMISEAIAEGKRNDDSIFSTTRFQYQASKKNIRSNVRVTLKRLSLQSFLLPKGKLSDLRPGEGKIIRCGLQKVGVYKDEGGKIYAVSTRCPHLGCMLEWNKEEKSWDCPCHGSRFDYKGKLLSNPSVKDLKSKENKLNSK